jgi:Animal haem peroxidase
MFPFLPAANHAESDLIALANFMVNDPDDPSFPPMMPFSGVVYFAQFLLHDLTLDTTPLSAARMIPPEQRVNRRSPFLDLDSLYGEGPEGSPYLYRLPAGVGPLSSPGNERFILGKTPQGKLLDLPRTSVGRPILADPRNEENLILAQLHALLLHFHNRVMDLIDANIATEPRLEGLSRFEQARQLVIWHYQYVVLHDLLRQFLPVAIVDETVARYRDFSVSPRDFCVPVEFGLAAFRFGHSLVLDEYVINTNSHPSEKLEALLNLNSMGQPPMVELADEWVIEWNRFFDIPPIPMPTPKAVIRNRAARLDTHIATALHNLPGPPNTLHSLPAMTLLRGARSGLPSGQRVADALGETRLTDDEMIFEDPVAHPRKDFLSKHGLLTDTPLWYYVLQEAAAKGNRQRLGPVGSRIVAETIVGMLACDPNSILNRGAGWSPPRWGAATPNGPITDLNSLVSFALS